MVNNLKADIVVMGAGLVGLAAAVSLSKLGKQLVLINAKSPEIKKTDTWDSRIYAITPGVKNWLQKMDVWSLVEEARVNDVEAMRLWGEAGEAALKLNADEANISQLAYIIENQNLAAALWQKIKVLGVTVVTDDDCQQIQYDDNSVNLNFKSGSTISAKLLVAADGANSFVRKQLNIATKSKAFNQTAVVANFITEQSHHNVARQWFSSHQTLALLPLPLKQVSMVLSVSAEAAGKLLNLTRGALVEQVQIASGNCLGALSLVNDPLSFELKQVTAQQLVVNRVALVGDAAHQIHPMAGQGMNLGFRDIMALQDLLQSAHGLHDIGDVSFLRQYERNRKADILAMSTLTSGLDFGFSFDQPLAKKLRAWGMRQFNKQALMKDFFIKKAVA